MAFFGLARKALARLGKSHPQSAAIPYRERDGTLEVLLVTTRGGGPKAWIVPKGAVERGMTEPESAANEAMEEGGVTGHVGSDRVGCFRIKKNGARRDVAVFDLKVSRELEDWPERRDRRRRWADVDKAAELVAHRGLAKLIRDLPRRLEGRRLSHRPDGRD